MENKIEIWKYIPDTNNLYQASNFGNIKSLNYSGRGYEKTLTPSKNKNGYLKVTLNKKSYYVHILVCRLFIPNINNLPQVNHKNGDKIDNNIENLEWVTNKENCEHKINILKYTPSNESKIRASINHNRKLVKLDLLGDFICEYKSCSEASTLLKINRTSISYCCNGIRNTAGGYKWAFK